jgi:hypothetical protein
MNLLDSAFDWCVDHIRWFLAFAFTVIIGGSIFVTIADQHQWDAYAKQHHCAAVGTKRGQASTGLSMDGKGTIVTTISPNQTIYTCDNGEMQIR